jgi:SAM-dependent methyltransferase
MNLTDFQGLFTDTGRAGIAAATALTPREQDFLAHFQKLSKQFPSDIARSALETAIFRLEAQKKFGDNAKKLFFTREALEQATPWQVAAYRAKRFAGFETVLDLGCSIGGDTLYMSKESRVIGIDRDELRLTMARANMAALGLSAEFALADLNSPLPFAETFRRSTTTNEQQTAIFFDPARRSNQRRIYSIKDYQPPLSKVHQWGTHIPAAGVKISPGVKIDELNEFDCEIEFISLNGELKEACLWFGPLKTAEMRATVLPGGHTLTGERRTDADSTTFPVSKPRSYLYEPDPAVIRAGLVTTVGEMLDAGQLDSSIAYLTGDKWIETPFARVWEIEDWMPFNLKKLRAYLRENNVGKVTVKKRGSPITPEQLIRDLKLKKGVDPKNKVA